MTQPFSLYIEPDEAITFKGNFTRETVSSNLDLTNPISIPVAFKVKTTAPRRYCVRPNSGIIQPEQTTNVRIILQPNQNNDDLSRHKFLVQTIELDSEKLANSKAEDLFKNKNIESSSKKLLCRFIDSTEDETQGQAVAAVAEENEPVAVEEPQVVEKLVSEVAEQETLPASNVTDEPASEPQATYQKPAVPVQAAVPKAEPVVAKPEPVVQQKPAAVKAEFQQKSVPASENKNVSRPVISAVPKDPTVINPKIGNDSKKVSNSEKYVTISSDEVKKLKDTIKNLEVSKFFWIF